MRDFGLFFLRILTMVLRRQRKENKYSFSGNNVERNIQSQKHLLIDNYSWADTSSSTYFWNIYDFKRRNCFMV